MLELDFIIQSRLGSSRLPFKAALQLPNGIPSVKGAVVRCEKIIAELGWKTKIYVACPADEVDVYQKLCSGTNAIIYGGDPNNVALRMLNLTDKFRVKHFIRVTADNPYICLDVVEYLASISTPDSMCLSLFHQKMLPNGTVVSVLSKKYLEAIVDCKCPLACEHLVTSQTENINNLIETPDIPQHLVWPEGRFCIDDAEDYLFIFENPGITEALTVPEMRRILGARKNVVLY